MLTNSRKTHKILLFNKLIQAKSNFNYLIPIEFRLNSKQINELRKYLELWKTNEMLIVIKKSIARKSLEIDLSNFKCLVSILFSNDLFLTISKLLSFKDKRIIDGIYFEEKEFYLSYKPFFSNIIKFNDSKKAIINEFIGLLFTPIGYFINYIKFKMIAN